MSFGLSSTGLQIKRVADIKTELEAAFRATFGQAINLDSRSILGQIIGIVSEREALVWELIEAVYLSQYPDTAEGVQLENVAALTGTTKKTATKSTGTVTLIGDPGTVIDADSVISKSGDDTARFVTDAAATLSSGTNEVQSLTFLDTPTGGNFTLGFDGETTSALDHTTVAADLEAALEALDGIDAVAVTGSFAAGFDIEFQGSNGLSPQVALTVETNALTSGSYTAGNLTITVAEDTPGAFPQADVGVTAETAGATTAPAGTLTVIETPVSGWDSVTNALDITPGLDLETDQELKLRRLQEIAIAGKATLDAIRSSLVALSDVTAVVIFENNSALTDPDDRPPHSVDIVVQGGDQTEIGETIFDTVAAGIETIGAISESVTDSQGFSQTVKFSRPDEIEIYVEVDLTVNASVYPADGETQVKNLIVAFGEEIGIGNDVITIPQLLCAFANVAGILDVALRVGAAAMPAAGTATVTASNSVGDLLLTTGSAHGLVANNRIRFTSAGTLPTGLSAGVTYHVTSAPTTTTLKLSTSRGGDEVAYTDAGTGVHTMSYGGLDENISIAAREVASFDSSRITVDVP